MAGERGDQMERALPRRKKEDVKKKRKRGRCEGKDISADGISAATDEGGEKEEN